MKKLALLLSLVFFCVACQAFPTSKQTAIEKTQEVYYEIFVASFRDSDGDGIGDLKGITEKLPYLDALGVTGIWLMPIHPSDTYHKYDVKDYYAIDQAYGTMQDFEHLLQEAKKYNIKIIMDLVLNHTADDHPWFLDAQNRETCQKCSFYHFSDTAKAGYVKGKGNFYYEARFWEEMPDLNLENEEVKEEIKKIAHFWLEKGVHGFRLDAVGHFFEEEALKSIAFTKEFVAYVKSVKPEAFVVGEVWKSEQAILPYYKSGIDALFDFGGSESQGRFAKLAKAEKGEALAEATLLYNQKIKEINSQAKNAIFLSNHDQARSAGFLNTLEQQKLLASIYLLSPGVPFIYYGEEIGMKGSGKDENKRLAMTWGDGKDARSPLNSDYVSKHLWTVAEAEKDETSLLQHYKDTLALRHKYVTNDTLPEVLKINPKIFALQYGKHKIFINTSKESVAIEETAEWIDKTGEVKKEQGKYLLEPFAVAVFRTEKE